MVNEFVGTPCNSSTTIKDLIETLLDRKEVPLCFSSICGIFAQDKKTKAMTFIPHTEMAQAHASQDLHFRVINIPDE